MEKVNWPDEIRLVMIERSEIYEKPTIYQYGYYDGYQKAIERTAEEMAAADMFVLLEKIMETYEVNGNLLGFDVNQIRALLNSITQ